MENMHSGQTALIRLRERYATALSDGTFSGFLSDGKSASEGELQSLSEKVCFGHGEGTLCFSDIDYAGKDRASWGVLEHLTRLFRLARAYRRGETDGEMRRLLFGLLDEWLLTDPHNPNWWYNQIGVPALMGDICLLLAEDMTEAERSAAYAIVARGSISANPSFRTRFTGANLLWIVGITVRHALLLADGAALADAIQCAAAETKVGKEGIQADASFFQHGRRLYSGGYGRSFVFELAALAYLFRGSEYGFPHSALEALSRHLLDGLRHMTQGKSLDYAVVGREYTRPGALSAAKLIPSITWLTEIENLPRREEMRAYLEAIRNAASPVSGVRYYPDAAYLTLHTGGIFIGFKGADRGLLETEICNSEGILGYNLSYGTHTTVMRDGEEYADIAPLWDYARIPGTAARDETDAQLLAYPDFSQRMLEGDDFGGAGFSDCGVCYSTVVHEGVSATVSCFATPFGAVLLGCNLSEENGKPLTVTVEQCFSRGAFEGENGRILHNGILYCNLDGETAFRAETVHRVGSWHRNSTNRPDTPVEGELFTLTLSPKDGRYAYAILPEGGNDCFTVLRNDGDVQAVRLPDGRVLAVYHRDATLSLGLQSVFAKGGRVLLFPAAKQEE